uniref:MICOS complex subunit MIC60 n=1 Tax=Scleropages formosus TaxID=113540 RepID=A0A8C9TBC3_SCLFO
MSCSVSLCLFCLPSASLQSCLYGRGSLRPLQPCCYYSSTGSSGATAGKLVGAGLLFMGGGLGGTILYAKWDPKFRANVEKSVPYSEQLFQMTLGPPASPAPLPKKAVSAPRHREYINSHIDNLGPASECVECKHEAPSAVKERPAEEVAVRLALQDQAEQDVLASLSTTLEEALGRTAKVTLQAVEAQDAAVQAICTHTQKLKEAMEDSEVINGPHQKSTQWSALESALKERSKCVDNAADALQKARSELENLRGVIAAAKKSSVPGARAHILAAEENLHRMSVDLDNKVSKVQSAQTEAKIISQYSELVREAKTQFQKELNSITPDIQGGWKGLTGKLTADDLNSLIAHAHRRIDQLNRELAEQRVREQLRIETALEQQRLEDKKALDGAVAAALERRREEVRLEQERKVEEVREVMEAEMRTQLRRQAAAHTDHLRDVLKVQEQELRAEAQESLNRKLVEQETEFRRMNQQQINAFTQDVNTAFARLKGMEDAIDSHAVAEEEARRAHQLWLAVEALGYTLKTAAAEAPTEPLAGAVQAIRDSCGENEFAQALATALPEESLQRGVYSEASLRARFYSIRKLARRVAMIDETRNSLYQYFLSYLQSVLLFEPEQVAPPAKLSPDDMDTFKLLSYATYCIEHGDLELAAKFVNQLRGESRRVAQDWLKEARLTLETRQIVSLLSAYANAVGLGTTQAP